MSSSMTRNDRVHVCRVETQAQRRRVIRVLRATYLLEKRWVSDLDAQIPADDLRRSDVSWFLVSVRGRAAGVVRVLYSPPLGQYAKYALEMLDPAVKVEDFVRAHRVAEIGRFAVRPRYRGNIVLAAALMRAATRETVARGYTHLVTDVFEDDPHSPYGFHTRVIGFRPVATHDAGELHCRSRRITLLLDLKAAYLQLKARGNWVFRYLTGEWDAKLHNQLAS